MGEMPNFFAQLPVLRLYDPLAELLGASADGVLEYRYADAVRLAGHSCPTVAAAWNMTRRALAALYPDGELPQRGQIRVSLRGPLAAGVNGVLGSVVGLLTGAAGAGGFKGLGGRFDRRDLLAYDVEQPLQLRFARCDRPGQCDVGADLTRLGGAAALPELLERCLRGTASPAERRQFAELWQARVRRLLLEHADDPAVFPLYELPA